MKRRLRYALHLLLVTALLVAALPAHGLINVTPSAAPASALDGGNGNPPVDGGCTHHAKAATEPHADSQPDIVDHSAEDCCGPDCRCACAGLTLVLLPSMTPLAASPSTRHGSRAPMILPSRAGSELLRPPQS